MSQRPPLSRPVKSVPSLEKRLAAYALTAAAAGIGLGLTAPSAEARIIYVPADKVLTNNGGLYISLDHIPTWRALDLFRLGYQSLTIKPLHSGGVMFASGYAQALGSGASIGPNGAFQTSPVRMERAFFLSDSSYARGYGPWTNVANRYLGLRYVVNGQTHYGWARFNVTISGNLSTGAVITATFTGYAIETAVNTPIQAGKTSGPDSRTETDTEKSGSLGCLALGCAATELRK
jgi:hypothetical protein